jgi:hypothetical protein
MNGAGLVEEERRWRNLSILRERERRNRVF